MFDARDTEIACAWRWWQEAKTVYRNHRSVYTFPLYRTCQRTLPSRRCQLLPASNETLRLITVHFYSMHNAHAIQYCRCSVLGSRFSELEVSISKWVFLVARSLLLLFECILLQFIIRNSTRLNWSGGTVTHKSKVKCKLPTVDKVRRTGERERAEMLLFAVVVYFLLLLIRSLFNFECSACAGKRLLLVHSV